MKKIILKTFPTWTLTRALVLSLLIPATLTLGGCKRKTGAIIDTAPVQAVRIAEIHIEDMQKTLQYVGTIRSEREVKIQARLAGTLVTLPADEGDTVSRGTIIGRLSVPDLSERARKINAEVSKAAIESSYVCKQQKTDEILVAQKAIPQARLDASTRQCDSSKRALEAAHATQGEFGATQGKSVERAPFNGWVLQWLTQPGEHVFPGKPILILGDDTLEVRVNVSESDAAKFIRAGTKVMLRMPEGNGIDNGQVKEVISAFVTRVSPMAKGPGRMVEVGIRLPAMEDSRLPHGSSVDISFIVEEEADACTVPVSAIANRGGQMTVYKVVESKAVAVPVTVLIAQGDRASISPKLPEHTQVVLTNLDTVRDGMPLYTVPETRKVTP
ncbi:efflux RND transporter periplasmic adaptor subunit [Myxococcota bacterium]|nr:efflux RND transporter periplasmic adaptor subunit [Myxococcota bacterium]